MSVKLTFEFSGWFVVGIQQTTVIHPASKWLLNAKNPKVSYWWSDAGNYFRYVSGISWTIIKSFTSQPPALISTDTQSRDSKPGVTLHLLPKPDVSRWGPRTALVLTESRKQTGGSSTSDAKRGNCKLRAAAESLRCTNVQTAAVAARYSPAAQLKFAWQTRSLWLKQTILLLIQHPGPSSTAGEESHRKDRAFRAVSCLCVLAEIKSGPAVLYIDLARQDFSCEWDPLSTPTTTNL